MKYAAWNVGRTDRNRTDGTDTPCFGFDAGSSPHSVTPACSMVLTSLSRLRLVVQGGGGRRRESTSHVMAASAGGAAIALTIDSTKSALLTGGALARKCLPASSAMPDLGPPARWPSFGP
jgi:hypothetical protein